MARTPQAYSVASVAPTLQRIWTAMRVMRRFHTGDLQATAEADKSVVEKYVRRLRHAGYLRLAHARVSGRPGSRDIWALVRDSGPMSPIARKDGSGVYDPNTQKVWKPDGTLAAAPPPAREQLGLTQAHREALVLLASSGELRASVDTLRDLHKAAFITFEVTLTELGTAMAQHLRSAKTQRAGAGVVDSASLEADVCEEGHA